MKKLLELKNIKKESGDDVFWDIQTHTNFLQDMTTFCGKIVTISSFQQESRSYLIEEDSGEYYWCARWFEPIKNKKAMKILYGP